MSIFTTASNTQAYLKAGLMGFAGAGKTYTASQIAIGLHRELVERELLPPDVPVYFLDTETGSDWVNKALFQPAGVPLASAKTRAFDRLLPAIAEVSKVNGILLIDSISHFWTEFMEAYQRKRRRDSIQFQDWAYLKREWRRFTDAFVNSQAHIIMAGRAGYEYDFFTDEQTGKRELEKTGVKMRAETETGYEPSLLILMERHDVLESGHVVRVDRIAHVLKDRSDTLDGKVIRNPTYADFASHVAFLSLGDRQLGVDARTSDESIEEDRLQRTRRIREEAEIVLDEVQALLVKHHPGQAAEAKRAKAELLETHAGTPSWKRVSDMRLKDLKIVRDKIWEALEGEPYHYPSPSEIEAQGAEEGAS